MSYHKTYYGNQCKKCGHYVDLDDVDYQFQGCQDEYLYCPKCNEWIFVKVRFNKICRVRREKGE